VTELTGGEGDSLARWEQVYPFLVQADDTCADQRGSTLHAKRPETITHLLDVLEFLSIKGAERELWAGGSNPGAKALTKGATPVGTNLADPKKALAMVEDAMATCLPGVQGTIHLPPMMAALLENSLQESDGKLTTFSGSQVVVGAGYAGQSGGAGKSAIYGTGPVVVHLGPTSMVTDELAQMANITHNQFTLRAERLVAVTFDGCCHVGATVTI
jgi:hypothetical protein